MTFDDDVLHVGSRQTLVFPFRLKMRDLQYLFTRASVTYIISQKSLIERRHKQAFVPIDVNQTSFLGYIILHFIKSLFIE